MTASNTSTRIYCPVEYRRFQAGQYAFVVRNNEYDPDKRFEVVRIAELFADGFSTDDAIEGVYVAGDVAYPAVVCLASMGGCTQDLYTDNKAALELTLEEVYSANTLRVENEGYAPVVRAGYPTLDVDVTFEDISITVVMGGETTSSGRGFTQSFRGVPYVMQTAKAFCATKEEIWNTMGFFNHLRGRGKPFWVRSELDFLSISGTTSNLAFTIDNPNAVLDMVYLKYLWIEDSTGVFDIVAVAGIEAVAGGSQIALASNTLADIASVRQAHAVRLSEDVIDEEYLTDTVMLSTFTVQELQGI